MMTEDDKMELNSISKSYEVLFIWFIIIVVLQNNLSYSDKWDFFTLNFIIQMNELLLIMLRINNLIRF